ncbi:MAG: nucleotidyltransferase domain-containing protein [Candidatus Heimdallarchaeota archaeon]|nr:nucleotidyltransferase domain-containing protein [Candidatus Heimdallarchaeota archaeon]MBY8995101.1 nucleotidyltransferase domain-containing protein [Candidatus Heimdallarchaeota archaeon]
MTKSIHEIFEQIKEDSEKDPNILGLILGGSRGKGFSKVYSDYDFLVVVKEDVKQEYREKFEKYDGIKGIDCGVKTISEFEAYAEIGSEFEWDRYNFAHVQALIDETNGELQKIIDEKGRIPEKIWKEYTAGYLDGYINSVYRSLKCLRDNYLVGYRLEAASSIGLFLTCAFAFHNRRLNPYYKYLEIELENFPLDKFPWSSKEIIEMLLEILETGDYKIQQILLKEMEKLARKDGLGHVFDSWDGDEKWTMSFKPEKE